MMWFKSIHLLFPSFLLWRIAESFATKGAFVAPLSTKSKALHVSFMKDENDSAVGASRRDFFQGTAVASIGLGSLLSLWPRPAIASGGATAGGVYLLSAKQRYDKRVVAGTKAFLALSSSLEGGSLGEAKSFFAGDDEGTWKDLSTAGYLLANAFRTSSTTPPDRLPSVKVCFSCDCLSFCGLRRT